VRAAGGEISHPLLTTPENENDVLVVLLTSDRGLCGNFNSMINRATQERVDALVAQGKTVRILCYGKKGKQYFGSRKYEVLEGAIDIDPRQYQALADAMALRLVAELADNRFSACYLAWNEYKSVMTQEPRFAQILPMQLDAGAAEAEPSAPVLYEPSGPVLLGQLLPLSLRTRIFQSFLETQAGEQAKRMTAMDAATRNASDLIGRLTLEYNRARQAAITKELIEIISGAEAL
jgi:F-type H+-transporting ATPase subunit gamma